MIRRTLSQTSFPGPYRISPHLWPIILNSALLVLWCSSLSLMFESIHPFTPTFPSPHWQVGISCLICLSCKRACANHVCSVFHVRNMYLLSSYLTNHLAVCIIVQSLFPEELLGTVALFLTESFCEEGWHQTDYPLQVTQIILLLIIQTSFFFFIVLVCLVS